VCGAYDITNPSPYRGRGGTTIGRALWNQADNVVHGGNTCRENVALFFTDGAWGDAAGVPIEAAVAAAPAASFTAYGSFAQAPYFSTQAGVSNAYVFKALPPSSDI